MSARVALEDLQSFSNKSRVSDLARFFKTGPGEYGEGDQFFGVTVPRTRSVAKKHQYLELREIQKLFNSPFHEARLCAAIILNLQFKAARKARERTKIFNFYLKQVRAERVNNWDIVDVSAPWMGVYLTEVEDPMPLLIKLSKSKSLWQRRVSIILTFALIRDGDLEPTIIISKALLKDDQDLIHKAVGWMLRELGKKDVMLLRKFLTDYSHQMPRTTLRYSIENLSTRERKKWLVESRF
ncbi:MAG: DNA alkylation repair protein [Actinobacteria bacterium]|nr:DNA alkylation repair protein [Actinomycetota bacterium]